MDERELTLAVADAPEETALLETAAPVRPQASPKAPLLVIRGGRAWTGFELADLWAHRDLCFFLAWRDVKVRYKQTVLGIAWAVLQPLLTTVVFTILFGRLAHVPSDGAPYAIFAYAGLLPWNFFTNAVINSSSSLVGNANLITKVYFPRLVIPGAAVGAALVDFLIAAMILFVMMAAYGVAFTPRLLMFPVLTLMAAIVALGAGMWMSALNVKYRDVRYALPFALQLGMFVTPVIYPVSFVPARWRWLIQLNPLTGIIEGFRDAICGRPFAWPALTAAAIMAIIALVWSAWIFRRMEAEFADVI